MAKNAEKAAKTAQTKIFAEMDILQVINEMGKICSQREMLEFLQYLKEVANEMGDDDILVINGTIHVNNF